uniref:ANF_receptor domain-containing protein n=1 Tax=Angiostrongylus cantonensis TaxID=6313 RepID=A0A0K0D593_ANGCA
MDRFKCVFKHPYTSGKVDVLLEMLLEALNDYDFTLLFVVVPCSRISGGILIAQLIMPNPRSFIGCSTSISTVLFSSRPFAVGWIAELEDSFSTGSVDFSTFGKVQGIFIGVLYVIYRVPRFISSTLCVDKSQILLLQLFRYSELPLKFSVTEEKNP